MSMVHHLWTRVRRNNAAGVRRQFFSTVVNRPYRESRLVENRQPKRSFTGSSRFCLQPRYRSVVRTEACLKGIGFVPAHLH